MKRKSLQDWTLKDLRKKATKLNLSGRSSMNKKQLVDALKRPMLKPCNIAQRKKRKIKCKATGFLKRPQRRSEAPRVCRYCKQAMIKDPYGAKIIQLVEKLGQKGDVGLKFFLKGLKIKDVRKRYYLNAKTIENASEDELDVMFAASVNQMVKDSTKKNFHPIIWLISNGWFVYPQMAGNLFDEVKKRSLLPTTP